MELADENAAYFKSSYFKEISSVEREFHPLWGKIFPSLSVVWLPRYQLSD